MTTLAAPWPQAITDPQGGRRVAFEPMTSAKRTTSPRPNPKE